MILLTGGLGYIGAHTAIEFISKGYDVVLFDNLDNSDQEVVTTLQHITGKKISFVKGNILDTDLLVHTIEKFNIKCVVHFAGHKSVDESSINPMKYYLNNVQGSISLILGMQKASLNSLVFSSSATVYGLPCYLPYDEAHPLLPVNTYGKTKLQVEQILRDLCVSDKEWRVICLRYFNPVGAHGSGLIGDNPKGIPNNLMPYLARVATEELPYLNIYGSKFNTRDGTCERDFIHILDLAESHVSALKFLRYESGFYSVNIGTGNPYSVLELVNKFGEVIGRNIPYQIKEKRSGDLPTYFANADLAKSLLGWEAKRGIYEMCQSAWNFQLKRNKN